MPALVGTRSGSPEYMFTVEGIHSGHADAMPRVLRARSGLADGNPYFLNLIFLTVFLYQVSYSPTFPCSVKLPKTGIDSHGFYPYLCKAIEFTI